MKKLFIFSLLMLLGINIALAEEPINSKPETKVDCEKAMKEQGAYAFLPTTLPVECQGKQTVKVSEPESVNTEPETKLDKVIRFLNY